jgi:hypothetical protein
VYLLHNIVILKNINKAKKFGLIVGPYTCYKKKRKKSDENQRQRPRDKAYKCACIDRLSKLLYKYKYKGASSSTIFR